MSREVIFKYPLILTARQILRVPIRHMALSCQLQRDELCLWMAVDSEATLIDYPVTIVGTGHEVPKDAGGYIGTVQMGEFVWHIYGGSL